MNCVGLRFCRNASFFIYRTYLAAMWSFHLPCSHNVHLDTSVQATFTPIPREMTASAPPLRSRTSLHCAVLSGVLKAVTSVITASPALVNQPVCMRCVALLSLDSAAVHLTIFPPLFHHMSFIPCLSLLLLPSRRIPFPSVMSFCSPLHSPPYLPFLGCPRLHPLRPGL